MGSNTLLAFIPVIIWLAVVIVMIASMWKVFVKAGLPGWGIFVPIYNLVLILQLAGKPWWWLFLFCIPLINFVVAIIVTIKIAENFGKSTGFGIGLLFLGMIFYPILAFGDAEYKGAEA